MPCAGLLASEQRQAASELRRPKEDGTYTATISIRLQACLETTMVYGMQWDRSLVLEKRFWPHLVQEDVKHLGVEMTNLQGFRAMVSLGSKAQAKTAWNE